MESKPVTLDLLLAGSGIKLKEIAGATGKSLGTVSKIVNGVYPIPTMVSRRTRAQVLTHIALRLEKPLEEIEARVPDNTNEPDDAAALEAGGARARVDRRTVRGRRAADERRDGDRRVRAVG